MRNRIITRAITSTLLGVLCSVVMIHLLHPDARVPAVGKVACGVRRLHLVFQRKIKEFLDKGECAREFVVGEAVAFDLDEAERVAGVDEGFGCLETG